MFTFSKSSLWNISNYQIRLEMTFCKLLLLPGKWVSYQKNNKICLISNFTSYINHMSFNTLCASSYTVITLVSHKVMKIILLSFKLAFSCQTSSALVVKLYEKQCKTIVVVVICLCFLFLFLLLLSSSPKLMSLLWLFHLLF